MDNLIDLKSDLERGVVLRCPGSHSGDGITDLMIIELSLAGKREYALMVVSGYKAGMIFVILPEESYCVDGGGGAISTDWLRKNWSKWGYVESPLEQVQVFRDFSGFCDEN
ncbi:Imm45 family immunity protein [Acidovorax delafieldii]|uniref:Imm45 family immunity protein n=1 Tax=Acidovorax delafieldii TaxID=47920 RepID=UPI003ECC9B1F